MLTAATPSFRAATLAFRIDSQLLRSNCTIRPQGTPEFAHGAKGRMGVCTALWNTRAAVRAGIAAGTECCNAR
jgi:hypothetical protein